ncbi:MAG: hypothetical protein ACJ74K_00530 [Actinomycetes bacterium]|jgi:hypothetical protein
MATDRDEQLRQQRELEEIRRSFAEMGARMGSMFEPPDVDEPERTRLAISAPPATPTSAGLQGRPRWWWAAALILLFVAGTAFGYILPKGDGGSDPPSSGATTPTTQAQATPTTRPKPRTVVSVPDDCLEAAQLADEVISRLNRNNRDNRLALALRDYTIASQACRREASP